MYSYQRFQTLGSKWCLGTPLSYTDRGDPAPSSRPTLYDTLSRKGYSLRSTTRGKFQTTFTVFAKE